MIPRAPSGYIGLCALDASSRHFLGQKLGWALSMFFGGEAALGAVSGPFRARSEAVLKPF